MPIIRNSTSELSKRIVRFAGGLIPQTDAYGEQTSSGRYAHTSATMGGETFVMDGYAGPDDMLVVWCSVSGAGYIMGNADLYLRVNGDTVRYKVGEYDMVSIPLKTGFHIYGFLPTDGGIRLMYDGAWVNSTVYQYTPTRTNQYMLGGISGGSSPATLVIRKAICRAYADTTGSLMYERHYYPTSTSTSAGACGWYETRIEQAVKATAGTVSGEVAEYGVSLDDLREVTGSGFHDLMAITCEDGGDALSQADGAETLTKDDVTRTFAFMLDSSDRTDPMPIPSGWALAWRSGDRRTYSRGDLIMGRNTKWNIWADRMTMGRWIENTATSGYHYEWRCNIYHNAESRLPNDGISLEDFEGLCNIRHVPKLELTDDTTTLEYHNGVTQECSASTLVPEYSRNPTIHDDHRIFFASFGIANTAKMCLGNLADWFQSNPTSVSGTNALTGMAGSVYFTDGTTDRLVCYAMGRTSMMERRTGYSEDTYVPFCSLYRTNAAYADDLARFRDGLRSSTDRTEKEWAMVMNSDAGDAVFTALRTAGSTGVTARAMLTGINGIQQEFTYPIAQQMIWSDRIVPSQEHTLKGAFDTKVGTLSSITGYRCVLATPSVVVGGVTRYLYPVWRGNGAGQEHRTRWNDHFALYFCFLDKPVTDTTASLVQVSDTIAMTLATTTEDSSTHALTRATYTGSASLLASPTEEEAITISQTVFPDGTTPLTDSSVMAQYVFKYEESVVLGDTTTAVITAG